MKKKNKNSESANDHSDLYNIPKVEILDLEQNDIKKTLSPEEISGEEDSLQDGKTFRKLPRFLNLHMLLLLVVVVFVVSIFVKFRNWGVFIDQNDIIPDETTEYRDILDQILPLMTETGEVIQTGPAKTILLFGNNPFADDRGSKDNLANIIAEKTGATVYNCAVSDSCLSTQSPYYNASMAPLDAYSFYWLVTYGLSGANANYYPSAAEALGEDTPEDAQEVLDTLDSIDMTTVDVIAIMYDATDYLLGRQIYNPDNNTDIEHFTGGLEAGIELIQANCPNTRIIVMSPTYAYAIDHDGSYVSSDMYTYGKDVLSVYSILQVYSAYSHSVTYIDNLYGTITEDNADQYLIDNIHLNVEGRNLVADRFVEALNAYNRVWEE